MTRIHFIVPVHQREALAEVCLRQLRRTCDAAADYGHQATAVVIGEGRLLDFAWQLGFDTVERDNDFLGRRFNDGYQLACDPTYNPEPADYVIPCGSDNWIHPVILRRLPPPNTIGIFRHTTVVNEDRTKMSRLRVGYKGGCGIRIVPRSLLEPSGYRPCSEDIQRGCDTSTLEGMKLWNGSWPAMRDLDVHPMQIVGWKSAEVQLNPYRRLVGYRRGGETAVDWGALWAVYPAESVREMRALA